MRPTDSDFSQRRRAEPAASQPLAATEKVPTPDAQSRRPRREHFIRQAKREGLFLFNILSVTAVVSVTVLWFMGVLGSGKWDSDPKSPVKFITQRQEWDTVLRESAKPVLLAFYSESCPSCKRMRSPFLDAASDPECASVQFVAINAASAEMSQLADTMNIQHVPSLLYFSTASAKPILYKGAASQSKLVSFVRNAMSLAAKDNLESGEQVDRHKGNS